GTERKMKCHRTGRLQAIGCAWGTPTGGADGDHGGRSLRRSNGAQLRPAERSATMGGRRPWVAGDQRSTTTDRLGAYRLTVSAWASDSLSDSSSPEESPSKAASIRSRCSSL